jgi:hypothetical protein
MNTFLKVILVAFLVLVAIKLLPVTLVAGCILALAALAVLVVGVSAAAALLCLAFVLAAALAPIWLPVLAVVGIISLVRRSRRASA